MEKIAFLGLGHMGAPMAARLVGTQHPLTVWNRNAEKAAPLVAAGAALAPTPAEAVRGADVVITMLAGPAALEAVAEAIVPELRPGAHWVEMSTVGPGAVGKLAARLGERVTLVDAPVVGSVDRAAAGRLAIFAGGAADGVAEILARLGTVTRTGASGSGAALKLVLNAAALGGIALVAEALALADALGLDEDTARAALAAGPLGGAVGRAHATDVHFAAALAAKDLALATEGARLPALDAVAEHYRRAAEDPATAHEDIVHTVTRIRRTS
ncbi:NAD(P)-binding domain-containing protein [Streptomyces sp. NPDC007084]|uniref:NAD(P)-dependent oxidoreductase n=1 Tax=Streptomyces sp. NPDC007084 TaxID=3154313 RepID=UPI0034517F15